jgi:hypothetical protein
MVPSNAAAHEAGCGVVPPMKTVRLAAALAAAMITSTVTITIDPTRVRQQGPTLGAFVWYNYYGYNPPSLYSHYPPELAALDSAGGAPIGVRLAAMLQPTPPQVPVGLSRTAMAAHVAALYTRHFLGGAQNFSQQLSALHVNNHTVLISWAPPESFMSGDPHSAGKVLPAKHVTDYARFVAASVAVLVQSGVRARYVELSNEPDGDWNCRIYPAVYAQLVLAAREELDAVRAANSRASTFCPPSSPPPSRRGRPWGWHRGAAHRDRAPRGRPDNARLRLACRQWGSQGRACT